MVDLLIRFLIGGAIVSLFAMLGDVLRPKSFAGLFGAAPSIALATVGLSIHQHGKPYTAYEARSMILAAAAFLIYAAITSCVLRQRKLSAFVCTIAFLPVWFAVSLGLWTLLGRLKW
jgi:hypothetical protein